MTTINAHKLRRLIRQTRAHISPDDTLPPINGIRFECDGVHIHVLATDCHTFAAARTKVREESEKWAVTIAEKDLGWVEAWLRTHSGDTILNIAAGSDNIGITGDRGTLTVPTSNQSFPKWQELFRAALEGASESNELTSLDTSLLARWEQADSHLRVWQSAPTKPLLLVGHDFLGLQMPARYSGDDKTREVVLGEWAGTLGELSESVVIDTPPEPGAVAEMATDMLRRTLLATNEMFSGDIDMDTETGRAALVAWIFSGTYAWSAYRLLQALKTADPDLAEKTVRDLNEQLESGEIGEWAWDAATAAGHDPQAWQDERKAQLKKAAAKNTAA